MAEGPVVSAFLRELFLVVRTECFIVAGDMPGGADESVAQQRRTALGHPGAGRAEIARLPDDGIKPGEGNRLLRETLRILCPRAFSLIRKKISRKSAIPFYEYRFLVLPRTGRFISGLPRVWRAGGKFLKSLAFCRAI